MGNSKTSLLPLVLTASVSTRGMVGADFSAAEREQMYLETLRFYLGALEPERPLVFAENSGWDLQSFAAKLGSGAERVEFIAVDPEKCDIARGKGYNELILLNDAIGASRAVAAAGAFFKVTGRYPVYNLRHFLEAADRRIFADGYVYYGDLKDHRIYDWLHTGWCGHAGSAAYFASRVEFFRREVLARREELDDRREQLIEHLLFRVMKPFRRHCAWRSGRRGAERMTLRFDREPVLGGRQGSNLAAASFCKSNDSPRARAQRLLGNCIRVFTPWFWF